MPRILEDFESAPETRWSYVADGVMGGVSQGQAEMVQTEDGAAVRLTGDVSTDNNGGFIQVRQRLDGGWPAEAEGLTISAKGNDETYYVFVRTSGLARVWYYYSFPFEAGQDWAETEMPFAAFEASNADMPQQMDPGDVISIGIVAYGRDHEADVTVRSIGLF